MTIGAGEAVICLALLVLFIAYAVWTSPAVRVAAWAAFAAVVAHVLFGGVIAPTMAGVAAGIASGWAESHAAPPNTEPPNG